MSNGRFGKLIAALLCLHFTLAPSIGGAQIRDPHRLYDETLRGSRNLVALDESLFGDKISLQDGKVSFEQDDVSLPTNSGLRVAIGRKTPTFSTGLDHQFAVFGIDWDLNVPYMMGTYDTRGGWNATRTTDPRCSTGTFVPMVRMGPYPYYYTQPIYQHMYWHGININIPGQGEEQLLKKSSAHVMPSDGNTYVGTTKSLWRISCLPTLKNETGEGFAARLPDGTTYYFDWMAKRNAVDLTDNNSIDANGDGFDAWHLWAPLTDVFLYASKVVDRFGNSVSYTYDPANPGRIKTIESSDGARLDVEYYPTGGQIYRVKSGTRTWTYVYTTDPYDNGHKRLVSIEQPDTKKWTFAHTRGYTNLYEAIFWSDECRQDTGDMRSAMTPDPRTVSTRTMTHPSGAKGEFKFRRLWHGTNNTPGNCILYGSVSTSLWWATDGVPSAYAETSLYEKKITGAGLPGMTWSFSYAPNWSFAGQCASPCPNASTTLVSDSTGATTRYRFGNDFSTNVGQLLTEAVEKNGKIVSAKIYSYLTTAAGQPFPDDAGTIPVGSTGHTIEFYGNPFKTKQRPRKVALTQLDDATSTFNNTINSFDRFVRPLSVTRSSTIGFSKTDVTAYHDDLPKWVLGQVATVTCTTALPASTSCNGLNDQISKIDYDANAMPWKTYTFGKLQQTLTYDTTSAVTTGQRGTLKTVTDGNNSVVALTGWKRGIPQQIQHPATPDHPVVYQKAGVSDNGEIDWVTDENNYKTCYTYDPMGRLASITYPDEVNIGQCDVDQSHWKMTTITFRNHVNGVAYAAARGLPAGHWRQYVDTGANRKVVLFDALWRPVVEETYDNTSPTTLNATLSEVAKRYDSRGRLVFRSYPVRPLDSFTNPDLKGVRTEYDAIDRVTAVRQDAESGLVLSTTTAYLPGFKTQVTPPKGAGYQTTTSYMAYDQPTTDWPEEIAHPEGVVTKIERDALGKPLTLTRRDLANTISSTRSYAYNINHELCRTVEPETGTTSMGYDGAGNLAWSAAGFPAVSATTPCADGSTSDIIARKVSRTYDQRNRLKSLDFPDTRGSQTWKYQPDGLPWQVHTTNVPGTMETVNTYDYNKRRMLVTETVLQGEWFTFGLGYAYDGNGSLKRISYPSSAYVDFAPNALGQPTEARNDSGHAYAHGVTYYPNGAIAGFTFGNGIVHSMTPNERQLPRFVADAGVFDLDYRYDPHGNVDTVVDAIRLAWGHQYLDYDGLDRLTHMGFAQLGGNHHMYFTYDALDNLKTWKHPADGSGNMVRDSLYCYDAGNRLQYVRSASTACSGSVAGAAADYFQYDVQGNVETHDSMAFDFDYGNRLREIIDLERYRYDAHGRRVLAMNFATGIVFSQYGQSGQLLYQLNERTGQKIDHIYLGGSLIAQREQPTAGGAATVRYQHTDALGSPVAVTNADGAVIEQTDYAPYGQQKDATATVGRDRPGYTGHVRDQASGLNYMQQRYYDPLIGRFLSVDPVTANSATGANFNRYWYANNNPYKFIDPDGRATSCANQVCTMTADTYNAAKSTGQTTMASPDVKAATEAGKGQMAAGKGPETLGFVVKGQDGKSTVQPASNVTTGKTSTGNTASASIPQGAQAVVHGHIDKGPDKSNGMVDDPKSNGGYGDTQALKANLPVATISQGQVGWHEIQNGQLQFAYPQGALNSSQGTLMQNNLNNEQKLFQNP